MPATQAVPDLAARTQTAKRLFPIYSTFTERFGLPKPPIADARALKINSDPSLINSVEKWMEDIDQRIDAFQLRSVVHGSNVGASELRILALLERLLGKPNPDTADRAKIDFLLAQLLAARLTLNGEQMPTLAEVAEVLEPVTGKVSVVENIPALETLTLELLSARRLAEVNQKSIIERGREAKNGLGESALLPRNLVACSRFNFMLRKRCFELMKEEVKLIKAGLKQLSGKGVVTLDCAPAKMSSAETISGLLEMCQNWQERTPDNYAHDNPFSQVLAVQEIVEKALAEPPKEEVAVATAEPVAPAKHAEEPIKPTPDVIQIYAELAELRREHHQLDRKVHEQGTELESLRHTVEDLQGQVSSAYEETRKLQATLDKFQSDQAQATRPTALGVIAVPTNATSAKEEKTAEAPTLPAAAPERPAIPESRPAVAAKPPSMQEIFESLTHRMEEIRDALVTTKVNVRKEAPSHLKLGGVSIMLTASEAQAFLSPSSQADELICRGAAARFLLLATTKEVDKETSAAAISTILSVCEAGAAQLQEQAAHLPQEQADRVLETARLLTKSLKGFSRQ